MTTATQTNRRQARLAVMRGVQQALAKPTELEQLRRDGVF